MEIGKGGVTSQTIFIHCFEDGTKMKIPFEILLTFNYFLISLLSQHRLDYVRIKKRFLSWMQKMPEFTDKIYAIPPEINNTEIDLMPNS